MKKDLKAPLSYFSPRRRKESNQKGEEGGAETYGKRKSVLENPKWRLFLASRRNSAK